MPTNDATLGRLYSATLILDSDSVRRQAISAVFEFMGHEVLAFGDSEYWQTAIDDETPACVAIVALRNDAGVRGLYRSLKERTSR